ncbi:MAG TPA: DUF1801 domain-containing protein [Candidatus Acidoferrum sp.]|nr:DUF1801 domain-containing protein [Candidatus Acidoferrum sp.]
MKKAKTSKAKPRKRASAKKGMPGFKTVDEYLARVPEPARTTLNHIRAVIREAAPPEATEVISYKIPAIKYKGVLVWFAAFASHCSLFPTAAVIEQFKDELKGYTLSKGTIQFPIDKPLPDALVRKMVEARVAQVEAKSHR